MAPSTEATPESAVAAPLQAIGTLGVPVTALPSGGLCFACACRRVPSRESCRNTPMPHPRMALPRRAAHVLGFPTGPSEQSRRAPQLGAEVVAGLYVDHRVSAHGAFLFLASSHPPCAGIRFILLILTDAALAAIRLMRACARVAACLLG